MFFEANPEGKTIPPSRNRDGYTAEISFCTLQRGLYRALQALHAPDGCLWTCAVRESSFYTRRKVSTWAPVSFLPAAGDKQTMQQGSAERSQCYSVSLVQRVCFIFRVRRQAGMHE